MRTAKQQTGSETSHQTSYRQIEKNGFLKRIRKTALCRHGDVIMTFFDLFDIHTHLWPGIIIVGFMGSHPPIVYIQKRPMPGRVKSRDLNQRAHFDSRKAYVTANNSGVVLLRQ